MFYIVQLGRCRNRFPDSGVNPGSVLGAPRGTLRPYALGIARPFQPVANQESMLAAEFEVNSGTDRAARSLWPT